ncbi:metallophosphoesterase family protein [Sphingomonas sp. Leaf21]|uniref:metallophosphoesterase family protein n=1 Tax=Sphingomonas sp. Leaf21 TaxID=2876550 RepID=UPI001E52C90B|nr:metallophosphoesterase family protein [Sphingomonas sp. Leaf21]
MPVATLPAGRRVYAIGDIHGEADLLVELLHAIRQDSLARGGTAVTLVFLGDFIDRGRESATLLKVMYNAPEADVMILKGNHEAALVDVYRGDEEALAFWLRFGGRPTLEGLGVALGDGAAIDTGDILARLRDALDPAIIDWLDALPHSWTLGDYFFAHAGVRPRVRLSRQNPDDLLWIREPFLSSGRNHGKVVVHGHTIEPGRPRLGGNRIGIDTGAHEHGCLTALGLEGNLQWLIQVSDDRDQQIGEELG